MNQKANDYHDADSDSDKQEYSCTKQKKVSRRKSKTESPKR